ncbi:cyclase family protein [Pseudonocardia dioxanivorans]|uniref:cyclase family protein n=1 Tax=Pseudonocardia dioxanivorans TaxID=240495 RepID=UPI00104B6F74|nr:cyclase family protein [Pseudonocardia dioxanivorans]
MTDPTFPTYAQLLARTDAPPGSAWGVWGAGDEIGTLNHLTPERVRDAAALVRTGERIRLDHPLEAFDPPPAPARKLLRHTMFGANEHHRDEYLDGFYTQGSSQLDGLRHFAHPEHGFYNGTDPGRLQPGLPTLGVNRYSEHGVVGRGVLVDVDAHLRARGHLIDHDAGEPIEVATVVEAAAGQGVELRPGDILMVRTGWGHHYLHELDPDGRRALTPLRASGLAASRETVEWLWDNRFAVVASDTFAVEAWPAPQDSPFLTAAERAGTGRIPHSGLMHRVLIPLLGMVLGELWALDELAAACAADGRWDCMLVATPLNLTGGVGSPSNAVAIR